MGIAGCDLGDAKPNLQPHQHGPRARMPAEPIRPASARMHSGSCADLERQSETRRMVPAVTETPIIFVMMISLLFYTQLKPTNSDLSERAVSGWKVHIKK